MVTRLMALVNTTLAVASVFALGSSNAEGALTFSNPFQANFKFTVVDGPFSGLGVGTVLNFEASGPLTFTLDDSVPNASTMNITNVTGVLTVSGPAGFEGSTLTPELEFVGGQLDNIVRNGGGTITSGNVSDLRMKWEMFSGGLRLYTTDSLPFNGLVTGIPFVAGNQLVGPDPFNVYLDVGLGAANPLAVTGSDRFLTVAAVPEPTSLALLSLATSGFVLRRYRRPAKQVQA